jgi:hypothetical protein
MSHNSKLEGFMYFLGMLPIVVVGVVVVLSIMLLTWLVNRQEKDE